MSNDCQPTLMFDELGDCLDDRRTRLEPTPRHAVAHDDAGMAVLIERRQDDTPRRVAARVVDFSRRGARILIGEELAPQESVTLLRQDGSGDLDLMLKAQVFWVREADPGQWRVGLGFDMALSDSLIDRLALQGHIDRRDSVRDLILLKATAQCQLGRGTSDVEIRDVSSEGFCMVADQGAGVGAQVRLVVNAPDADVVITARVKWQRKIPTGFLVGCEFLDSDTQNGPQELASMTAPIPKDEDAAALGRSEVAPRDLPQRPEVREDQSGRVPAGRRLAAAITPPTLFALIALLAIKSPSLWASGMILMLGAMIWGVQRRRGKK